MAIVDRVRELVTPLVDAAAVDLYDIEHHGSVVRVLVDHPDGLDLDVIARLSRSISRELDETDPIAGRYTLEVSSPGLERPLRTADHFRGAIGSEVKIKARPDQEGSRRFRGVVVAVDDHSVQIRDADEDLTVIELDEISSARTVFEWGPTPKPGGDQRRSKRSDREATS